MMFTSSRSKERSKGLKDANYILENKNDVFAIHYSCESFDRSKSSTPRVTSISIYNITRREQHSFNIHIEAQLKGYNCKRLTDNNLDASERSLLQKFYRFVKNHQGCIWVHWNMKNSKYGFEALCIRYKFLTKRSAPKVRAQESYNLDVLLRKLYGHNFEVDNCNSKLFYLAQRNDIPIKGMLLGIEEGNAFSVKNYQAIMESSQSKAEAIGLIMKAAGEKSLKVNSSLWEIYGISLLSVALFVGDNFTKIKKIVAAIGSFSMLLFTLWKIVES